MNTLELLHRISRNARDQYTAVDTIKLIWPNANIDSHIDPTRPAGDKWALTVFVRDNFVSPSLCLENNCRTCDNYA